MANLNVFVIAIALSIWMIGQMAGLMTSHLMGWGASQIESFEKQALSSVQGMSASDLDLKLADRPFESWLKQIVGPKTGIVWQLAECGERFTSADESGPDMLACAEVNAKLLDGRRVFVAVSVGTFKKGLNGKPSFYGAAIEQNQQLYTVRRLSDLPEMLRDPDKLSNSRAVAKTITRIVLPPIIKPKPGPLPSRVPDDYLLSLSANISAVAEDLGQPPPPPPEQSLPSTSLEPAIVSESELQGRAVTKVKPVYPPNAKKMHATGPVEVEVIISEEGLVLDAKAISGHIALRSAAVDAARKWVFKPANLNGALVRMKSVLTFVFAPSAK